MIIRRVTWFLFALLAIVVGLYPLMYSFIPNNVGLLSTKSQLTLDNPVWITSFYGHIIFGGLALMIGWIQFSDKLRNRKPALHRGIGKLYVIAVLISGVSALTTSYFGSGGIIAQLGFASLALTWLFTTSQAFLKIKSGNVTAHEKYMIYSYAVCFAAVTLRIYLPLLQIIFGEFILAYQIVAWLCWVPNLIIARLIISQKSKLPLA